jgi:hypothetical protein
MAIHRKSYAAHRARLQISNAWRQHSQGQRIEDVESAPFAGG